MRAENQDIDSVQWRAAREEDLDVLAALERECFPPPRGRAWSRGILGQLFNDAKYRLWLGFLDATVVAYAIFWSVGDEAEIDRIGVALPFRRRGLGRAVMQEILRELENSEVQQVFLEVRDDNLAARRLYETLRFTVVGQRPNYYDDGCAAWILRRELKL